MKKPTVQTLGGNGPHLGAPAIDHHSYTMAGDTVSLDLDAAVLGMLWEIVYSKYLTARGSTATMPIHQRRFDMLVDALIAFEAAAGVKHAADKKAKPLDAPLKPATLRPVSKPRIIRKRGN